MSKARVVEKIIRSLPPRFDPKITTVEESKDVELLDVNELVESLITYETRRSSFEVKNIDLKTTKKEKEVVYKEPSEEESSDSKSIAMLTTDFQKYLKNAKWTSRKPTEWLVKGESKKDTGEKSYLDKKTIFSQCFECQGFGNNKANCGNLKNARANIMIASLSDDVSSSAR